MTTSDSKCPLGHHASDDDSDSALIETLPFPVIVLDPAGNIKSANHNLSQILDYDLRSLLGKSYFDTFHPASEVQDAFDLLANQLNRSHLPLSQSDFWNWLTQSNKVYEKEWTYLSRQGQHIWAQARFAPLPHSHNIIVSFFDVSNYKKLISELGDSELKTRMIFETAVDGFVTIDKFGTIQSFNRAAEKLFGYSADEVIGQNVKILTPPEISVKHDGYLKNYQETRNAKIIGKGREVYGKRKNDTLFPMYLSVGEGKLSGGSVLYTGIIRDLTEYKKAEDEIKQTNEKLDRQNKIKTDINSVIEATRGTNTISDLANAAIVQLAQVTQSPHGALYIINEASRYSLAGTYACSEHTLLKKEASPGHGLLGQVIQEAKPIILANVPQSHITIDTSLGQSTPENIAIIPILFERKLLGLFELASFEPFSALTTEFLELVASALAPNIQSVLGLERTKKLLEESNRLSEALRDSNQELKTTNEALTQREEELRKQNFEIERAKQDIENKARELEQTSSYKSQFLANMSHELRTPLNSLLILAKILIENREGNLSPKQIEHAKLIHNSGNELLNLINDILDLAKVESGKMTIVQDSVSTAALAQYIQSNFHTYAENNGLEFNIESSPNLPETLKTDEVKLKQILKNFLSNAFKFTAKGHVAFKIHSPSPQKITFSVSDTGIGIPQDKQGDIFEAFRQVDGTIQRKFGGTGLGMTISNEYAKLLGGSISLQSTKDVGSTFTLTLPLQPSPPPQKNTPKVESIAPKPLQLPTAPTLELDHKFDNNRVLIVDDDVRNIFAITSYLEDYGMDILYAENGQEAIEVLAQHHDSIDIILMDIMMPEMDGHTTIRRIRSNPDISHIPIIALTAKAMSGDREECIKSGASDYISKPVDTNKLIQIISNWTHKNPTHSTTS